MSDIVRFKVKTLCKKKKTQKKDNETPLLFRQYIFCYIGDSLQASTIDDKRFILSRNKQTTPRPKNQKQKQKNTYTHKKTFLDSKCIRNAIQFIVQI